MRVFAPGNFAHKQFLARNEHWKKTQNQGMIKKTTTCSVYLQHAHLKTSQMWGGIAPIQHLRVAKKNSRQYTTQ